MLDVFVLALGLGLVFNAAPGAVFAESLRRGIRGGFRPALTVQVGSLLGDLVWAVLGLAGVGALFTVPALRVPLTAAGCLLLAWLGITGLRDALGRAGPAGSGGTGHDVQPGGRRALSTGAAMSLANPWNVVYWAGAAGAVSGVLGERATAAGLGVFLAGFLLSSLAWCFVAAGIIAALRRGLPPAAVRIVEAVCGAALIAFAVLLLLQLLSS